MSNTDGNGAQQQDRVTHECWKCNGEIDHDRETLTCLDCGSQYEIAPTGEMVKHRRMWWVIRIGYVAVLLAFVYALGLTVVNSNWPWTAVTTGLILMFCYTEGPEIIEMVRQAWGVEQ